MKFSGFQLISENTHERENNIICTVHLEYK